MPEQYDLKVLGREHFGAVGLTQSGKTYAMLRFLDQLKERNVIIVDTKHNVRIPGYKLTKDPKQAVKEGKIIWRPQTAKPPGWFFQKVWDNFGSSPRKPNVTLYLDEAGNITSPARIDTMLEQIVQAGKQNGVGVWWAAQRPTRVHNTLLSQSEKLLIFRVITKGDRKKLADSTNDAAMKAIELEPADSKRGIGGEFIPVGFPDLNPIQADGKVNGVYLRVD